MRIALILAADIKSSPYIKYYTDILDSRDIEYDIISWNRKKAIIECENTFNKSIDNKDNVVKKLVVFNKYRRFIDVKLKNNDYDYVIVFTLQLSIVLSFLLLKKYKQKYILDIRDYNLGAKLKVLTNRLVNSSKLNVISSNEYKTWLPSSKYVISHNCRKTDIIKYLNEDNIVKKNEIIKIATIGMIRDFTANKEIVDAFKNDFKYEIYFIGDGIDKEKLEQYCKLQKVKNVKFLGVYKKEDELVIYKQYDIINNYTANNINSTTLMSNRFYNSLLANKPMIFMNNSYMWKIGKHNNLGVEFINSLSLKQSIIEFFCKESISGEFLKGRKKVLNSIYDEICIFEQDINNIIDNNINKFEQN